MHLIILGEWPGRLQRFGPQQTVGTIIQHVRPVDLQASMAQGAAILARWATLLGQRQNAITTIEMPIDFAAEAAWWQQIANEFTVKTRLMWRDGWFRDYDSATHEWSSQQDTMHLAPVFCGAAGWEQVEQLRPLVSQPPPHSGWTPLSWPPVVLTLVGAAAAAQMPLDAAELAYRFIDAAYRSTDSRESDQHGSIPGVMRLSRQGNGGPPNMSMQGSRGTVGAHWASTCSYAICWDSIRKRRV